MPEKSEEIEWPTIALLATTYLAWVIGTLLWGHSAVLSLILTGVAVAQYASLQHEALHGHPFRNETLNEALVFPAITICVPYRRFRDTHLQHHFDPSLTDPYDDPESGYCDPQVWNRLSRPAQRVLRLNNTLLGRIVLGPFVGTWVFLAREFTLLRQGDRDVMQAWALNMAGLVPVLIWLHMAGMPILAYLGAVYVGFGLSKIRTYLEHRAHETCRARTAIVEDRGPLSLLFLNNNFHAVHHMHPKLAWYKLPALYLSKKEYYQRHNGDYVYAGYGEVFRRYLTRAKEPVPHPIWPVRKDG
ncbi:MAG: fatty acid desaturase [Cypionkella sp.]